MKKVRFGIIGLGMGSVHADALAGGGTLPLSYVARTALYALLYTAGILCLGGAAFQHAEVS